MVIKTTRVGVTYKFCALTDIKRINLSLFMSRLQVLFVAEIGEIDVNIRRCMVTCATKDFFPLLLVKIAVLISPTTMARRFLSVLSKKVFHLERGVNLIYLRRDVQRRRLFDSRLR